MSTERVYTVDHISGEVVTLVDDETEQVIRVHLAALPDAVDEGVVLRVLVDTDARPVWREAQIDAAESERRRAVLEEQLRRLRGEDAGDR